MSGHIPASHVRLKRIYAAAEESDGRRILVDRLWPRGISHARADLACWAKDVAPSTDLRKWFGHQPERWEEFQQRYRQELKDKPELLKELRQIAAKEVITLLFAARDEEHNEAIVLRKLLLHR